MLATEVAMVDEVVSMAHGAAQVAGEPVGIQVTAAEEQTAATDTAREVAVLEF